MDRIRGAIQGLEGALSIQGRPTPMLRFDVLCRAIACFHSGPYPPPPEPSYRTHKEAFKDEYGGRRYTEAGRLRWPSEAISFPFQMRPCQGVQALTGNRIMHHVLNL